MFQQRTSSQKPGDELLANFRQQFPEVAAATSTSPTAGPVGATAAADPNNPVSAQERTNSIGHEAFRDEDPTPRASNDPWRFTPSLLDPNSFSFSTFGNIPQGYYTPTPGGTNTLYHPQAGDLHTPTMGLNMGLGTPMSMPSATDGNMHPNAPMLGLTGYQQTLHHPQFHGFNAFIQPPAHQPSFAPSSFVHHDTGYETMDQDGSPIDPSAVDERLVSIDHSIQGQTSLVGFQPGHFGTTLPATAAPLQPSAEKFRFHATLNAPTAMIKHADEIPVTYLNKGQAYSLSIVDSMSTVPIVPGTRYRTYVRISFEDEQQRQKPGVCWSLWKEGRGTNEAHQRGGKLQAVEYVEAGQPAEGDDKRTRVELESATFNGFSVVWTPGANGVAECSVAVRFNFLSTDFSHSKGVKGIPVRLCAKTNQLPPDQTRIPPESAPEICYCKVKLFRDHGAERKLSNDVAHVKKTIDKLKQQIAQAESGMKDFGKRKRSGVSQAKTQDAHRPGKVLKHKRTWSMSSASSAGGTGRPPAEEDLQYKLQTLQDMFTSTRPASILYLRGEKLDDPDLHPVVLPGEPLDLTKAESKDNIAWRSEPSSVGGSSLVSPSPSSLSLNSQLSMGGGGGNTQWQDPNWLGSVNAREQPTKVKQTRDDAGNLINWIEALGVDASYKPPLERNKKPVACFYVAQRSSIASSGAPECYRAIYLMQRTVKEFIGRLAAKWNFDPAKVVRVVHVLNRGLEVEMDDDVIRELDEGQDMLLDIVELNGEASPATGEWDMAVDSPGESETSHSGYQLRLTF